MTYAGSSRANTRVGVASGRNAITKTGNAHLRRVLMEAAWRNRHRPVATGRLRVRQTGTARRSGGGRGAGAAAPVRAVSDDGRAGESATL